MSGGAFEYSQYKIEEIQNTIQFKLEQIGKEKHKDELFMSDDYYEKYPEEKLYPMESEKVIEILEKGIDALRIAKIYADRIDKYLSGDDSEYSLITKLNNDLNNYEKIPRV